MTETSKTGPVLIELDDQDLAETPADVAPVPETPHEPDVQGRAMQTVAALAARRPSALARWFWGLLGTVIGFFLSLAAWNTLAALLNANPLLGMAATVLVVIFVLVCLLIAVKELAMFSRLARMDRLHDASEAALASKDLKAARKVLKDLESLYSGRDDTRWGRDRLARMKEEILDADGLLGLAEREVIAPLDQAARQEIETAARQVATVTALVPLALADVITALTTNLRMIRRIAEIYGGRSGTLGSMRLARAVMRHLVATGAVAVGDDLLGSVAGGSILGKLSRRFGEGLVNGALTARVGVAAMEVCRPMPFAEVARPAVSALLAAAMAGVFDRGAKE